MTHRDFLPDRTRTTEETRKVHSAYSHCSLRTGLSLGEGEFDWIWQQKVTIHNKSGQGFTENIKYNIKH